MKDLQLYSVNDLMNLVADALTRRTEDDCETLNAAAGVVRGWLQPQAEQEAQLGLIEAAIAAIMDTPEFNVTHD